ncbi:MAG: radical SAM protein [archaeon]
MKILFIIADQKKFEGISNIDTFLFLGISQLSAVLEKEGHEVKVRDMRIAGTTLQNTLDDIEKLRPNLIILSSFFSSIKNLVSIGDSIKERYNIPISIGGIYPTLPPIKVLDYNLAAQLFGKANFWDFIVIGEGEIVYPKLLSAIARKKEFSGIQGLMYRVGKKIRKTIGYPIFPNLDYLPMNAFHLFNINNYLPLPKHYKRTPILPLTTSRDCAWGKCEFCFQSPVKGFYRRQSPKRVIMEIKKLMKEYNIKDIRFWDDDFIHSPDWIYEFCRMLQDENLGVIWNCHTRVNQVTLPMLEMMAKAGCWQILYGIESGNQELLRSVSKGITSKQAKQAIEWTKKAGIEARASFILGLPGETPEKTDITIRFAKSLGADLTQFSLFTPYPGTLSYGKLKGSKMLSTDFAKYNENQAVFLPEGYNEIKDLEDKFRFAYRSTYLDPKFLLRTIGSLRSIEDIKRNYSGLKVMLKLGTKK